MPEQPAALPTRPPTARTRFRAAWNTVNLSTPLGLLIALVGRARLSRGPRGLLLATGYRLPFPRAGAFTVGNVICTGHVSPAELPDGSRLLAHEERHASQWACCLGLPMLPLYLLAALWSLASTGDPASGNIFERRAGLADGGYLGAPPGRQAGGERPSRFRRSSVR